MFHQADNIKTYLSPYKLGCSDVADASTISLAALAEHAKSDLAIRADKNRTTYDFLCQNGLCDPIETALSDLKQKLPASTDMQALAADELYKLGVTSFENGKMDDAITAFTLVASHPKLQGAGLSALAAYACLQDAYDVALLFAQECMDRERTHPRTYLIAGYSALKAGDKKLAKSHLALATRLARSNARYRDEQRCAQRELLLMQLGT